MGCTRFAEAFDQGTDALLVAASEEAFASAGVDRQDVDAYWLGTAQSGMSGMTLAKPLGLVGKPVTRVENMCATGSEALAHVAAKNHRNGARNPRAQFRREVTEEQILAGPRVAGELGVFDCAGVADGAAAAVVVRTEDAMRFTDQPLYVKALSFVAGNGGGLPA